MDAILACLPSLKFLFGAVVGLAIGTLAGMTGMPLGALRLPAVYAIVPTPHIAAGTNLGIDTLTATTASYRYWREGLINATILLFMGSLSCLGSFLGGYSSKFVSYKWLLIFIGLTYFSIGLNMLLGQAGGGTDNGEVQDEEEPARGTPPHTKGAERRGAVMAALWGFILGFIGGMAGLLMGSLRVPTMIRIMGLTPAVAAGTNMAISSFMAAAGFLGHLIHRNLDLPVLLTMGAASIAGSYTGSRLGITLNPATATRLIGAAITMMAIVLFINGIRL